MNKENPKKNKKSFEYYIAQRKEEFRVSGFSWLVSFLLSV